MFGMGFTEIVLIAVVAIIALGPDKLPTAMVEIAKFIKKFKSGLEDAKSSLDNELNISEMKEEAAKYKAQIEDAKNILNDKENLDLGLDNIINEKETISTEDKEKVSLKEPKKKKKKEESSKEDNTEKYKVNIDENVEENK